MISTSSIEECGDAELAELLSSFVLEVVNGQKTTPTVGRRAQGT